MSAILGQVVPAKQLYPGLEPTFQKFQSLLRELSRDDALLWAARFNLILSGPVRREHRIGQQYCADALALPKTAIEGANSFAQQNRGFDSVCMFSRGQMLEMLRYCVLLCENSPDDGETFDKPAIRRAFSQASLIAHEGWAERMWQQTHKAEYCPSDNRHSEQSILRGVAAFGQRAPEIPRLLGRLQSLVLECFFGGPKGDQFTHEFTIRTGLTPDEYLRSGIAFLSTFLVIDPHKAAKAPSDSGLFQIDSLFTECPHKRPTVERHLAQLSQSVHELKKAWSANPLPDSFRSPLPMLPLLEKPVLILEDGRGIILDPFAYTEALISGPIFLSRQHKSDRTPLTYFGYAFETYCQRLLASFHEVAKRSSDFAANVKDVVDADHGWEMDAHIAGRGCNVVLEIKQSFIPSIEFESDLESQQYLKLLESRFAGEGVAGDKGILQLANLLKDWIADKWKPDPALRLTKEIFPVIVVRDELLTLPQTSKWFADRFDREFGHKLLDAPSFIYRGYTVHRLIMLNITEVENLELIIEKNRIYDLMSGYSKWTPDRMKAMTDYMRENQVRVHASKYLMNKGIQLLRATSLEFFRRDLPVSDFD